MIASVDIFQTEADGSVLWLGSARTMGEALAQIRQLTVGSARDYIVLNHATGNKEVIKATGAAESSELPVPDWEKACLEALSEGDPDKLPEKAAAAVRAVAQRLQELMHSLGENSEKIALRDAGRALEAIKNEKGPLPEWKRKAAD